MKQSYFLRTKELFLGSDIVRRFTFKIVDPQDNYALLARANHQLAMNFADLRDRSIHFRKKIVLNACRPGNMGKRFAKRTASLMK